MTSFFPNAPRERQSNLGKMSIAISGDPGSGKTWLAHQAPKALLLAVERGYDYLGDVHVQPIRHWKVTPHFLDAEKKVKNPEAAYGFVNCVSELLMTDHGFETVIIDTIDALHSLCIAHVGPPLGFNHPFEGLFGRNIKKGGQDDHGAAWGVVNEEMWPMLQRLLSAEEMGVIFISHAADREHGGRMAVDFGVPKSLAKKIKGAMTVSFYTYLTKSKNGYKFMATCRGHDGLVCAKDRTGVLPPTLELPKIGGWEVLQKHLHDGLAG